jgi:hypothetical protein
LIELEVIRDTFVTGIGDIQILGHNARIILYVDQGGRGGLPVERVVVAKLRGRESADNAVTQVLPG